MTNEQLTNVQRVELRVDLRIKTATSYALRVRRPLVWRIERVNASTQRVASSPAREVVVTNDDISFAQGFAKAA